VKYKYLPTFFISQTKANWKDKLLKDTHSTIVFCKR